MTRYRSRPLPSAEELAQIMRYDAEMGRLVWLPRKFSPQRAGQDVCRVLFRGRYVVTLFGRPRQETRVIWALIHGEWPKGEIDHIDGNPKNNDPANLRDVSGAENSKNMPLRKDNKGGVSGVDWIVPNNKWRTRISVDGVTRHIGVYDDLEEAKAAKKRAEQDFGFHPNHGRVPEMAS